MPDFGFRIHKIDLRTGEHHPLYIETETLRRTIGGASLAALLLCPHLDKETDPLSPEAPLLFLTGPLTGTKGPAVGRYVICAKSPATGFWGESHVGGYFGPEMRRAGFDGLWISGQAPKPIYIWLHDGQVEMRAADFLWGECDTYETQEAIRSTHKDPLIRVASIGIAGESGIPFASVMCDHGRAAGRTGMGAVMGSKNLKAIAVRGSLDLPIINRERFEAIRTKTNRELRSDNVSNALRQFGSASASDYLDYLGDMPKRYFTRGVFSGVEKVSGQSMAETLLSSVSACHGCVIACGRVVNLEDGEARKGPEYETIVGFGPNLEIDDLATITRLGELCDRYGMDTISVSNVIGLAFLLFQEGKILAKEADGTSLQWGDAHIVEQLIHKIGKQEGFGEILSQGARRIGEHYGAQDWVAHVKGLEVPYHDPRAASGMGLVYATSPRGACHNQSDYFMVEMGQTNEEIGVGLFSRQGGSEKAANVARHQDWRTVFNSLILCGFANVPPQDVLELVNATTDFDYDLDELLTIGERGWNIKRLVNMRMGLVRSDDRLPRILIEPLKEGGAAGYRIPIEEMLKTYYSLRGWDSETGEPSVDKLKQLEITQLIA